MKSRSNEFLLIAGLFIFAIGQFLIYQFGSTNKGVSSFDASHWLMLTGAVLYLPFSLSLPRRGVSLVASVLLTIGTICVIGMCVIDLVFWGLADDALRSAVAGELENTPSIWQPFMLWGNEEVLMTGFMLASFLHVKESRIGPLLVVVGSVLAIAGASWFNFLAYIFLIIGFAICFGLFRRNGSPASQRT